MVEYPPISFRDELKRVLSEEPELLADVIKEHFYLNVTCSSGNSYDSAKIEVELRGYDVGPILKASDTLTLST